METVWFYILWAAALLGVVILYAVPAVVKKVSGELSARSEILIKTIGMVISVVALIGLYVTGGFR